MSKLKVISVDLAKNVFQVCGMNSRNKVVFNRTLKRNDLASFMANQEATLVAMEACYSSHYWARLFESMGHKVNLLPAQHVSPFVQGNKSDYNDAVAIAEASQRPNITPVPIKTVEQQDIQCLHRLRERYVSSRTALINQARGLLSEFGMTAAQGHKSFLKLIQEVCEPTHAGISPLLKTQLRNVADDYYHLTDRIDEVTATLTKVAQQQPNCKLLLTIPGIGAINATSIYSAIGNGSQFANGREFSVWLGLTPKSKSSGEKSSSGGITKRGNRYLRTQLVHGARAALSRSKHKTDQLSQWVNQLVERRGINKACVALASRLARIAWVLLQRQETYKASV